MRIGIITPFDSRNFGNRLQNYALQQILLHYADQVVTIKNKPALPRWRDRLRRQSPLAESVLVNRLLGDRRKAKILQFNRDYLYISRKVYLYNRPCLALRKEDRCDWYCAGSDQIWNPWLNREGGFNFLTFAPGERTFSYAASFGVSRIPEDKQETIKWGLQHLRHISLREAAGNDIVRELTGRTDGQILPDPTLLLTREDWDRIGKKPRGTLPKRYLLTCFLGTLSEERSRAISREAEELGLQRLDVLDPGCPFYAIGPGEFLYLISRARLVCTDSFHASVFSFLYQRPLVIFRREGEGSTMDSRLDTLAETYHLHGCRAEGNQIPETALRADYSRGYAALETERLRAKCYLDKIFGEEAP